VGSGLPRKIAGLNLVTRAGGGWKMVQLVGLMTLFVALFIAAGMFAL
jgi:hypothetical protein